MATKTFKIGEYAIGGIIKVTTNDESVKIDVIDYFDKQVIQTKLAVIQDRNLERNLLDFMNEITTSYYADKVVSWINDKIKDKIKYKFMWV